MASIIFNHDLLTDLAKHRVVIFIGSGASSATSARLPGWSNFLKEQSARLEPKEQKIVEKLLLENDYLLACDVIKRSLKDEWSGIVRNSFSSIPKSSELHEQIKLLNQRIIVTTNFDKIIEKFWNDGEYNNGDSYTVNKTISKSSFKFLRNESPEIFKIHGCVDDCENIIFTKSDYLARAYTNPYYGKILETFLLNYTILFIGFSMDDPAISQIMEIYSKQFNDVRPHWIIHRQEKIDGITDCKNEFRKLKSITYPYTDNHKDLLPLMKSLVEAYNKRKKEVISDLILNSTA